jgi:hypothetical protein
VAAAALAVYGCSGSISDVRFVSVAPADLHRHLIVQPPYGPLDRSDLGVLLKVQFASDTDIRSYIKRYDAFVTHLVISPCPFEDTETFGPAGIYHNDVSLSIQSDWGPGLLGLNTDEQAAVRAEDAATDGSKRPRIYDTYFHYGYLWNFDNAAHQSVRRPVQGDPPDLCFRIAGRAFPWGGFRSNVAIIPRADLAAALARKP